MPLKKYILLQYSRVTMMANLVTMMANKLIKYEKVYTHNQIYTHMHSCGSVIRPRYIQARNEKQLDRMLYIVIFGR